jgi:uncharacterized membrane protein YfcA
MTFLLLAAGGVLGFSLGLLGAGGSILAVPALIMLGGLAPRQAMASGLLTVGTTALLGALLDARGKDIEALGGRLRTAMSLALPGLVGAAVGAVIAPNIPEAGLLMGFLALMLAAATRLLWRPKSRSAAARETDMPTPPSLAIIGLVGFGLGLLTGLFGIGGGFLVVPALVGLFNLSAAPAASISLMVIAVNAFAGLLGHTADGEIAWAAALLLTLGAVMGIVPGLAFKLRLPELVLRRSFATLLLLVGIAMAWQRWFNA